MLPDLRNERVDYVLALRAGDYERLAFQHVRELVNQIRFAASSSRMRSSSGRSSYFFGSAISRHNFDPDFLSPRGFLGLRFVVVVSDMSPPAGWLHCPGASPERKNLDKKRTQMHRCYGFSVLWRARGLPPTPVGANGFGPSEQVGSPSCTGRWPCPQTGDSTHRIRPPACGRLIRTLNTRTAACVRTGMSTFVLVHGHWHDGSSWARVVEHLKRLGHKTFTPRLPATAEVHPRAISVLPRGYSRC